MATPAQGALRWVRSAALAVATVGLAATAHVVAGADVPGWSAMAVLVLLTSLGCVLVTGRRRGLIPITVTMGGLQAMLHQGFMVLSSVPAYGHDCVTGLSAHAQHSAGALHGMCGGAAAHSHELASSSTMLLAHVAATLLLAAALAGGEHALWALRGIVTPLLPGATAPLPSATPSAAPVGAPVVLSAWTSVRDLVRRGPPVVATVALS